MNKMRYSYTEELFSHKMEQSANACYNMDELWQYYAKIEKPDTEDQVLHNLIYMRCLE